MWEMAYSGLPALLLVLAENQVSAAKALDSEGAAQSLGWATEIGPQRLSEEIQSLCENPVQRREMGERGTTLVDGRGTERTLIRMLAHGVHLWPAESEDDLRKLWLWVNDPLSRKMSFSQQEIGWEEHMAWHRQRKAAGRGWLWIAKDGKGRPLGQVRFDEEAGITISIGLAPDARGKGLGASIIAAGCLELLHMHGPSKIMAYIRPENVASIKAFSRAGFGAPEPSRCRDEPCMLMTYDAD